MTPNSIQLSSNNSNENYINDLEKTLLETQNFKREKSTKKIQDSTKMNNVYKNIQDNINLYDKIQKEKFMNSRKNIRDSYEQQIRLKSGDKNFKANPVLYQANPTRSLLDDLQTDNFRFKKELEYHNKIVQKQSNFNKNPSNEQFESQNNIFGTAQPFESTKNNNNKSRKILDMYGSISLGNLAPPQKPTTNQESYEKFIKSRHHFNDLQNQIVERDSVNNLKEKMRWSPQKPDNDYYDQTVVVDLDEINKVLYGE